MNLCSSFQFSGLGFFHNKHSKSKPVLNAEHGPKPTGALDVASSKCIGVVVGVILLQLHMKKVSDLNPLATIFFGHVKC